MTHTCSSTAGQFARAMEANNLRLNCFTAPEPNLPPKVVLLRLPLESECRSGLAHKPVQHLAGGYHVASLALVHQRADQLTKVVLSDLLHQRAADIGHLSGERIARPADVAPNEPAARIPTVMPVW